MSSDHSDSSHLFQTFKHSFENALPTWHNMNVHPFEEDSPMVPHGEHALNTATGEVFSYNTSNGKWTPTGEKVVTPKVTYSDNLPSMTKTIPSMTTTHTIKGENCDHPSHAVIPGTNTTVTDGVTSDGTFTHVIQPHETVKVTGDVNFRETSKAVPIGKADIKFTEQSSSPQYILQEKPVYVMKEKPVIVERPIYIEKPVEKPVIIEKTIDRPVYIEKIVEKPIIIEKTVERPVYIVHETPGVVIGREVNVRDSTHALSAKELEQFVRQDGLVPDEKYQHKLYVAPSHLVHDKKQTYTATNNINQPVFGNRTVASTTNTTLPTHVHTDSYGHHLHSVSKSELDLIRNNKYTPSSTTYYDKNGGIVNHNDSWSVWTPFKKVGNWFGGFFSSSPEHTTTSFNNDHYHYPYNQQFNPYASHPYQSNQTSQTNFNLKGAAQPISTPVQQQQQQQPQQGRFVRSDPTFLPSGGLLENASSSAAEHYYRFGSPETVDHPTDPIQLDMYVQNSTQSRFRPQTNAPVNYSRNYSGNENWNNNNNNNNLWISRQSASNDWHLANNTYSNNEVIPPSHPHATLTELGRNLQNNPYGSPLGNALGEVTEGVVNAAEATIDTGKAVAHDLKVGVQKTVDATVEGVDKAIDSFDNRFYDASALKSGNYTKTAPKATIDTSRDTATWWM